MHERKQWACQRYKQGRLSSNLSQNQALANFRLLTGHEYLKNT